MRIDSSGRLLVGTTTASGYTDRLLTVGDASTSSITAEIRSSSQGQISFSDGVAQNASSYRGLVGYNHGSDYMYLYTNSAERLRIDNSGNMSLGSSTINFVTQVNRTTLSLNGTNSSLLAFNYSDTISGYFYAEATEFRMEANGTRPIVFRSNSATRMIIDKVWAVVGWSQTSTSNNGLLCVKGSASFGSTAGGAITIQKGASVSGANQHIGTLSFGEGSANTAEIKAFTGSGSDLDLVSSRETYLTFETTPLNSAGPTERMRIDYWWRGRVLIGTLTEGYSDADDLTVAASGNAGKLFAVAQQMPVQLFFKWNFWM